MVLFAWQFVSAFEQAKDIALEGGIQSQDGMLMTGEDQGKDPVLREDLYLWTYQFTHAMLMLFGVFYCIIMLHLEQPGYSWFHALRRFMQK
jgi:hypothetical protein